MIGVFGGTFDPPHLGHIHLIKTILSQFNFSKLYLIPNYQNPLKEQGPRISAGDRLSLIEAAFKYLDPRIEILDWEIKKTGPSFTIDTVKHLQALQSEPITLVVGDDILPRLPEWKSANELLKLVDWLVIKRSEAIASDPSQFLKKAGIIDAFFLEKNLLAYSQDQRLMRFCDIQALPFSSTKIREEIGDLWKKNKLEDPPQGIQRSVWLLIKEKQLYAVR